MANKIFGVDYTNETAPTGTMTLSVDNGSGLVDVELQNLHKALTQATDTQAGTAELATNAEGLAGSDTTRAITAAVLAYLGVKDGWIPDTNTWTYSSADSPTFVISIAADMTALIGVGDRIKLTQTTAKYFIVTAVGAFSGGVTLITVYGGTDYTLVNAAISSPYYSHQRSPFGFPMSPLKWTVQSVTSDSPAKASPAQNTWYGGSGLSPTGPSIDLPIGAWRVHYEAIVDLVITLGAAGTTGSRVTLSTANNSESDVEMTSAVTTTSPAVAVTQRALYNKLKNIVVASKTTYYLNIFTGNTGATSITMNPAGAFRTCIRAVCAYL